MSDLWKEQSLTRSPYPSRGTGQQSWDNEQLPTQNTNSWKTQRNRHTESPQLKRNPSWSSDSSISSPPVSPAKSPLRSQHRSFAQQLKQDLWDAERRRAMTQDSVNLRSRNIEGWAKEAVLGENDRAWAAEEKHEENERNWAIEEKSEAREMAEVSNRKEVENDRAWEEAAQEHRLRERQPVLPKIPLLPRNMQRERKESLIRKPVPVQSVTSARVTINETPEAQPVTTTGTSTIDVVNDEDIPSPLRVSRSESWSNNANNARTTSVVSRSRGSKSWQNSTPYLSESTPMITRSSDGDDHDSESVDIDEPPVSPITNDESSQLSPLLQQNLSVPVQASTQEQESSRTISSATPRLVFQFKPQRQLTGSFPPQSTFPISPLGVTQVGSDSGSMRNLNEFAQSQYSVVAIVKYCDKDVQCDFDEPLLPPGKNNKGKRPHDGSLPTGSRLAILLVCTCMAIFLQALVSFPKSISLV